MINNDYPIENALRLYQSILLKAVEDATFEKKNKNGKKDSHEVKEKLFYKREATAWIMNRSPMFVFCCEICDINEEIIVNYLKSKSKYWRKHNE